MPSQRSAGRRRTAVVAAGLVLVLPLAGCSALGRFTAAPGARPGVDVPGSSADAAVEPIGVPPAPPPGSGGFAFLSTQPDGSPVAFDPCRPVHFVVRPDLEPAGGRDLLRWALGELSAATGLQFVDDGATDEAPDPARAPYQPDRYGDRWAPVLVAWSSVQETPALAGVLGRAGPDVYGREDATDQRFVSGLAVFNGPLIAAQLRGGDDSKARAVMLHELGHLVGLGHVSDAFQVMYDTNAYPLARYRAGDLRGLERLGRGRCFTGP